MRPAVSGAGLTTTMLLMSETRDAATPYSGALATRRLFPSASPRGGGRGHDAREPLSGVACVDTAVAELPADRHGPDAALRHARRPELPARAAAHPDLDGARAMGPPVDRLSPMLRRDLVQAQRAGR